MPKKKDMRHAQIGGYHRAASRYAMMVYRTKNAHLQRNSCYVGVLVLVSKDEFIEWFIQRDFHGCSVDRIDNSGHYELSNMQVIPLARNMAKERLKHINGMCICFVCKKTKPSNEFAKMKSNISTGLSTICKPCDRARVKNVSAEARTRQLARMRAYYHRVAKHKRQAMKAARSGA